MNKKVIEIKKWLLDAGLRQREVARKAGVNPSLVNNVIHGRRQSANVVRTMIGMGCPPEIFEKAA